MSDDLAERVAALEARLTLLENSRKGGRPRKKILVTVEGICGIEPSIDSATCPHANVYRRQQGCKGEACIRASAEYYAEYKRKP